MTSTGLKKYEQELDVLMEWVSQHLKSMSDVPRLQDVVQYAYATLGYHHIPRHVIAKKLRLHPAYLMNSSQSRGKQRWKRYRPILTGVLGSLHGDIGYFSVKREYETPITYRAGYLALKDVLSRYVYIVILKRNKSADSLVKAFEKVLEKHDKQFGPEGHKITSISFDQETSVMSNKVQSFLKEKNIAFHPFKYSASKSKFAENLIRLIRTTMARLVQTHPQKRWWELLETVERILNHQPIRIKNKTLDWRPVDVTKATLTQFKQSLYKSDPLLVFGQFDIAPSLVNFKYTVGTIVRPKLIITSSAVIGEKRSEINLEQDAFVITDQIAYLNARSEIGKLYRCLNQRTRETELFDEDDLAESV